MAVLAYRGMKEGSAIYRKVGKSFMQLHPEVDYPMILELVKKKLFKLKKVILDQNKERRILLWKMKIKS